MSIKVIHTSDWHLGKRLYKVDRLDEQILFLKWLETQLIETKTEVLIISGDIFDTPNPPAEALKAYYNFLYNITENTDTKIFIISGNHDSGKMIEAPSDLLQSKNIILSGSISSNNNHKVYSKNNKDYINLTLFPFFRNYDLVKFCQENFETHKDIDTLDILEKLFSSLSSKSSDGHCFGNILVAHHLFGNFEFSGSELTVNLSGVSTIPTNILKDKFDYLALGHIHNYQKVGSTPLSIYSGSPIPFRFSEKRSKFLSSIVFSEEGLNQEKIEIPSFRKLLSFEGEIGELSNYLDEIKKAYTDEDLSPLLEVKLHTKAPLTGVADYIREELKEINIELISFSTIISGNKINHTEKINKNIDFSIDSLFKQFYLDKYPEEKNIPPDILNDFDSILEQVHSKTNEVNDENHLN